MCEKTFKVSRKIEQGDLGFIYKITSLSTGHFYIGRKQLWSFTTKPPLKGQKRRRKFIKESDWETYTGSSVELNEMIAKHGLNNFTFEILRICTTKSEMSYYEVFHIITSGSMTSPLGLNKNCSRIPCRPINK